MSACNPCRSSRPPWAREYENAQSNEQVFTGDGEIDLGIENVVLKQTAAPDEGDAYEIELPDVSEGCNTGRFNIRVYGPYENTTAQFRLTGTFAGGHASYLFNNIGFNLLLEWRDDRYFQVGGNATPES